MAVSIPRYCLVLLSLDDSPGVSGDPPGASHLHYRKLCICMSLKAEKCMFLPSFSHGLQGRPWRRTPRSQGPGPSIQCLGLLICLCSFIRAEARLRADQRSPGHTHSGDAPSLAPLPHLGVGDCPICDLIKGRGEHRGSHRQAGWVTMTRLGCPRLSGPQSRNQGLSALRRQCFGVRGRNMWQKLSTSPATCQTILPAFIAPFLCTPFQWTFPKADRA